MKSLELYGQVSGGRLTAVPGRSCLSLCVREPIFVFVLPVAHEPE